MLDAVLPIFVVYLSQYVIYHQQLSPNTIFTVNVKFVLSFMRHVFSGKSLG